MRLHLITLLVILALVQLRTDGFAQSITLEKRNTPIGQVFREIEKQSGHVFFYKKADLDRTDKISIELKNAGLESAVSTVLKGRGLDFKIINKTIVIRKAEPKPTGEIKKTTTQLPLSLLTLHGTVSDTSGVPLPGVSLSLRGTTSGTITDGSGRYELDNVAEDAIIKLSMMGYAAQEVRVNGRNRIDISMREDNLKLQEISIVSTGYQTIPKERATGSFVHIDNDLLNRRTGTDIISRLEGVTSGMLFNGNPVGAGVKSPITIRGASTIYANDKPLIVLDNFEYSGDISNINPNDIESITVMKDAAAASIWGAKSGNGVIVITTKKGQPDQSPKVSFNSNVTIGNKPDLFYSRSLGSSEYIEVEKFLFDKGYYNSAVNSASMPALTPVVEILIKKRSGNMSDAEADVQINALKKQDVRNDFRKYLYRESVNQQYALNLSGGGKNQRYYISAGYDKNLDNLVGNDFSRFTVNANNSFSLLKEKLTLAASIYYTGTKKQVNNNGPSSIGYGTTNILYPYAKLTDENGNPLAIAKLRQAYVDTAGAGNLLDWNYRPLDEIGFADNTIKTTNHLLNFEANYNIFKELDFSVKYQYGRGSSENNNYQSQQTFYTRNYINQFTDVDPKSGALLRPVPLGGILDYGINTQTSENLRAQINYRKRWNRHELSAIAGYEIRELNNNGTKNRFYGYDDNLASSLNVDYINLFPLYYGSSMQQIIAGRSITSMSDRYRSYYGNSAYTYLGKYTLSISARKDESNLFGVKTNQKGVPLWSSGIKWDLDKEGFYRINWLSRLRLRTTYGYNGNIDKNVTGYLTTTNISTNTWGLPYSVVLNPPNSSLRWEKIRIVNFAADWASKNSRISGSIEYYIKNGTDLMGDASLAPSTGLTKYRGNSANIKGSGVDIVINTRNLSGIFNWNSSLLFNRTKTTVSRYHLEPTTINSYVSGGDDTPIEGRALYAIYSFRWAGLNEAGAPQGYLNESVSTDWGAIQNSKNLSNMVYNGPANPTTFGSLLNTFSLKGLSLSFNLIYKLGYYFKRPGINYSQLLGSTSLGDKEFSSRWQKPGDELITSVPAMTYPTNSARDQFYQNSEIMVQKGDHIRLQDIRLSYELNGSEAIRLPFRKIRVYGYINNLGIIWRANKYGIDPDTPYLPNSKSFAIGMNIDF